MAPQDTILAVVRGELPLLCLDDAGIHAVVKEHSYEEQLEVPVEVTPSLDDVAHGLSVYRNQADELRQWALFMMATEAIDFAKMHDDARGEELINALWDAGFGRGIPHQMLEHLEQMQPPPDQIQPGHEEDQKHQPVEEGGADPATDASAQPDAQ
jgi:hypothetical protein